MLENKVYLGHLEYGKRINLSYKSRKVKYMPQDEWKIVYDTHEPIISEDVFNRVQTIRQMNKKIRKNKHDWELNGVVKCKECGAKMLMKVKHQNCDSEEIKSKKIYCPNGVNKYKGKECKKGSKGIDEDTLNTVVYEDMKNAVKELISKGKIKEQIRMENYEFLHKNIDNSIELVKNELKNTEYEMEQLYYDLKENLIDENDYKKFYQEKLNQRNRISKELENLEKEKETKPVLNENKLNEIVKSIMKMKGIQKDIISDIIQDIQIDKDNNVEINYKYNIFNIA